MFNLNSALHKVDTKVMERMRFLCAMRFICDKIQNLRCLTLTSFTWHWSLTAWSVRFVVAFVSYSEMTESSELKEAAEADLLDATVC